MGNKIYECVQKLGKMLNMDGHTDFKDAKELADIYNELRDCMVLYLKLLDENMKT